MKEFAIISLILCYSLRMFSQGPYHKMLGDSNVWYISGKMLFVGISPHEKQSGNGIGFPCLGKYEAVKDSIFNTKNYKIFTKQSFICPIYHEKFAQALIREDTVLRRIYMIPKDSINERIVMDFSMSLGDSIFLAYPISNPNLSSGYYILDSVIPRPELIGIRKHFYLSRSSAKINNSTGIKYFQEWVESIGPTHFPVNIMMEDNYASNDVMMITSLNVSCKSLQYNTFVTCKYTDYQKYFQDSCSYKYSLAYPVYVNTQNSSCHFYQLEVYGEVDQSVKAFETALYPNPALDKLYVKMWGEKSRITIKNTLDQTIYDRNFATSGVQEIELSGLDKGIYLVKIEAAGQTYSARFVKE